MHTIKWDLIVKNPDTDYSLLLSSPKPSPIPVHSTPKINIRAFI